MSNIYFSLERVLEPAPENQEEIRPDGVAGDLWDIEQKLNSNQPAELEALIQKWKKSKEVKYQSLVRLAQKIKRLGLKKGSTPYDKILATTLIEKLKENPSMLEDESFDPTEIANEAKDMMDRVSQMVWSDNFTPEPLIKSGMPEDVAGEAVETARGLKILGMHPLFILVAVLALLAVEGYLLFSHDSGPRYLTAEGSNGGDSTPAVLYATELPTPTPNPISSIDSGSTEEQFEKTAENCVAIVDGLYVLAHGIVKVDEYEGRNIPKDATHKVCVMENGTVVNYDEIEDPENLSGTPTISPDTYKEFMEDGDTEELQDYISITSGVEQITDLILNPPDWMTTVLWFEEQIKDYEGMQRGHGEEHPELFTLTPEQIEASRRIVAEREMSALANTVRSMEEYSGLSYSSAYGAPQSVTERLQELVDEYPDLQSLMPSNYEIENYRSISESTEDRINQPEEQDKPAREFIEVDEDGDIRVDAQRFVYEPRAFTLLPNGTVIYIPEGGEGDPNDIVAKIGDDMGGGEVILVFKNGTMVHQRAKSGWSPNVPIIAWKDYFEMKSNLGDLEPATENGKIMSYIPNPNTPEDPTDVITVGEIENIPAGRVVAMILMENGYHKFVLDDGTYVVGTHIKPSDDLDTLEAMLTAQGKVMTDQEYDEMVKGHADYSMQLGGSMNKRDWERAMNSFLETKNTIANGKTIWSNMHTQIMDKEEFDGWWAELNKIRDKLTENDQSELPTTEQIEELRNLRFPTQGTGGGYQIP